MKHGAVFDWDTLSITFDSGRRVRLDITEANILRCLWMRESCISMKDLARHAISHSSRAGTAGVYVMRLRKVLGEGAIETIVGRGYILRMKLRIVP